MHWFWWWPMGWMGLFWLALIIVALVVAFSAPGRHRSEMETPEQILKKRYARGEITPEEYERMLADLRR